jgi:hypothetical protein
MPEVPLASIAGFAYLIVGAAAVFGCVMLLLSGIYMKFLYDQLDLMNTNTARMGMAVMALETLAKESHETFGKATTGAIDALRLLRHEIEYQQQINEIYRRKRDAEQAQGNGADKNWQYTPGWDQP